MSNRVAYLWDYDIDEAQFRSILAGDLVLGRLHRDWPRWRDRVRSQSRKRGLDFLVDWLPQYHPELL